MKKKEYLCMNTCGFFFCWHTHQEGTEKERERKSFVIPALSPPHKNRTLTSLLGKKHALISLGTEGKGLLIICLKLLNK